MNKEITTHENRYPVACQLCSRPIMKGDLAYCCLIKPVKLRHYATGWKVCQDCGVCIIKENQVE